MGSIYGYGHGKRKDKVSSMIEEIMEEYNIDPLSVPTGKKGRVVQYCHGNFTCPKCSNTWQSSWSWILFDLRQQRIRYRFHQKCSSCLIPTMPWLEDGKMRNLVEKVIKKYMRRENLEEHEIDEEDIDPQDDKQEAARMRQFLNGVEKSARAHRMKLCEKCGYGQLEACYASVLRKYQAYFKNEPENEFMDVSEE